MRIKNGSILLLLIVLILLQFDFPISVWGETVDNKSTGSVTETNSEVAHPSLPVKLLYQSTQVWYGLSEKNGFVISRDSGVNWQPSNNGLPHKSIYPYESAVVRPLTAGAVDLARTNRIAVTTSSRLFLSEDSGVNWRSIPTTSLPGGAYLTTVSLSLNHPETILIGTAFHGIYETKDLGKTWRLFSTDFKFLDQGAGFREEISAIAHHPLNTDQIIFACGYGKGLYLYDIKTKRLETLNLPELKDQPIRQLRFNEISKNSPEQTGLTGSSYYFQINTTNQTINYSWPELALVSTEPLPNKILVSPEKAARLAKAAHKFGIYLRPENASPTRFKTQLQFLKKYGMNSVVLDFKDDSGFITYESQLKLPKTLGAIRKRIDIKRFLEQAHENGIYVVGRLVVFKDQQLYQYQNHKYAIWENVTNQPWRNLIKETDPKTKTEKMVQREFWVDPYAREVWEYNIALAQELQTLGVDEIQFDYIRFPTDGNISQTKYRHRQTGMEKPDALESFLALARERISIPISTDLYGFNCWYRMDSWNGQNLEMFANYVDAVSPMFYPSHFPNSFLKKVEYLERSKTIYQEGSERAYTIVDGKTVIRPYVQAFLLGGERKMTAPTYTRYLLKQVEGSLDSPSPGFTLWNFSNRYYMVSDGLTDYLNRYNQSAELPKEPRP